MDVAAIAERLWPGRVTGSVMLGGGVARHNVRVTLWSCSRSGCASPASGSGSLRR